MGTDVGAGDQLVGGTMNIHSLAAQVPRTDKSVVLHKTIAGGRKGQNASTAHLCCVPCAALLGC